MPKAFTLQELAKQRRDELKGKIRQSTASLEEKIASGELIEDCINDLKTYGKNEFGDDLRWDEPGFEEILRLLADFRIARRYVSGSSQRYKMQRYDELIATSEGYKLARDIKVGDYLISVEGTPTEVLGVHPQPIKEYYKIKFKDGTSVETCSEHLWTWYSPIAHRPSQLKDGKAKMYWTNTTAELYQDALDSGGFRETTKTGKPGRYKYAIPMLEGAALMDNGWDCEGLDPYILGLLIGDGSYMDGKVTLSAHPDDAVFYISKSPHEIRPYKDPQRFGVIGVVPKLRALGIQGQSKQNKRIPEKCFSMHWEMRLELLRGLMDSDGTVKVNCGVASGAVFTSVVKELAEGVATLVRDLGGWATVSQYESSSYAYIDNPNKVCVFYHVRLSLPFNPFKLPRKADKYQTKDNGRKIKAIESITPAESSDGVCFTVAHERSLYLMHDGIVTHNTASCANVNAYMSQRAGLRGLWSFPKARTMEILVPKQHKPLLRNWAKVSGVTKITRDMLTSTAQFDVGLGSASFTHVNSGSGEASAGTSSVAVTADFLFCEEASQSSHKDILPLYRRVDSSRIVARPVTWLGTPGGGGGIEAKISDAPYEFWPHAKCPHCGHWSSLHPLGALLKSKQERAEDGTLITRWAHEDGLPLEWFCHDSEDPIETAYVGCTQCTKEISDENRQNALFKCIKTGIFLHDFLTNVVPKVWQEEQLEVGIWVGALSRPRKHLAREILRELSPEGIEDWYQQRLGIPSSAMANSIPKEALMNACIRPFFTPTQEEKSIRLIGIDQGRSAWYGAVVEFIYNPLLPPDAMYTSAKRNILALECFPSDRTPDLIERFGVQGGIIDNEPSIAAAAAIGRATGLKLGDQQAKIKDDYLIKTAKDGGAQFECFSLKYKKFFRFIFSLFAGSSVSVESSYLRFASGKVKGHGNVFKHLCSIEWDAEAGDIVKAKDGEDDLAFALMFAESAFGIFTVSPGLISCEGFSWDWYSDW